MAGSGTTQIINGQAYELYSPAWYAARQAEAQRSTVAQGTASGAALKAANTAAGLPPLDVSQSSTASGSSSSGTSSGSGSVPARVSSPALSGLSAAASQMGGAPSGTPASAPSAHLAHVDTSASEAASFARAKDQVGQETSGALTGLRSALGGRGLLGGGAEALGTAQVANYGQGQLGDVSRQQAITRADQGRQEATTNFQGDITQRGQDIQKEEAANSLAGSLATAGYSGQITQRGQDIQAQAAQDALKLSMAQLNAQQRSSALDGLVSALRVTAPAGQSY